MAISRINWWCSVVMGVAVATMATADAGEQAIFAEDFSAAAYRPGMRVGEQVEVLPGYSAVWRCNSGPVLRQQLQEGALEYRADNGKLANAGLVWWQRGNTGFACELDTSPDGPFADYLDGYLDGYGWIGKPGRTLYLAFLLQSTGSDSRSAGFSLRAKRFAEDHNGGGRLGFRRTGEGQFEAIIWPSGQYHPHVVPLGEDRGEVNLFVARIDFGAGANGGDRVSVWRNPRQLGGDEPEPLVVVDNPTSQRPAGEPAELATVRRRLGFDRLSIGVHDGWIRFDALRIGPTWASVTPRE